MSDGTRRNPPLGEVLDDAGELVPALLAPWVGLLWLTGVPLRLVQAHFAATLLELGGEAADYGRHLDGLARWTVLALLLSLWGRAVYCRACTLWLRGALPPGSGSPLRVPAASLAGYAVVALAAEVAFFATAPAVATLPALAIVAGVAAACSPLIERPGPFAAMATVFTRARHVGPLVALWAVSACAFVLTAANLLVLSQAAAWLLSAAAGAEAVRWQALLAPGNPRLLLVLSAASLLLVEPWWLAALVVHVHKRDARRTGEDLRLWFERLRSAAA